MFGHMRGVMYNYYLLIRARTDRFSDVADNNTTTNGGLYEYVSVYTQEEKRGGEHLSDSIV